MILVTHFTSYLVFSRDVSRYEVSAVFDQLFIAVSGVYKCGRDQRTVSMSRLKEANHIELRRTQTSPVIVLALYQKRRDR